MSVVQNALRHNFRNGRMCCKLNRHLRQHRIYRKNIGFKRKTPDK